MKTLNHSPWWINLHDLCRWNTEYKFWISSWPSSDINVFYVVIIYQITGRWYLITLCIPPKQTHSRCLIICWGWSTFGVFVGKPTSQIYIYNKRQSQKDIFWSPKKKTTKKKTCINKNTSLTNKENVYNQRKSALTKCAWNSVMGIAWIIFKSFETKTTFKAWISWTCQGWVTIFK